MIREYYIDGRVMVSGQKGWLNLGNPVKMSTIIASVIPLLPPSLFAVYTFQNGLTLDPVTLTVSWGGTLVNNTIIDGNGTFGVNFTNLTEFTINDTDEINFTSNGDINNIATADINNTSVNVYNQASGEIVNTSLEYYTNADIIGNTAANSITNAAGIVIMNNAPLVETNAVTIDNNSETITNDATISIINTTPLFQTNATSIDNNAETITNDATVSIINTTPLFQTDATAIDNNAETITNDATVSIINTTPLFQTDADTIDNNADIITNDATTSITSTSPLIEEYADVITEQASVSITNTAPTVTINTSTLYNSNNSVFASTCFLNSYYRSGENLVTRFDYANVLPVNYDGQFSAIEGENTDLSIGVGSGLFTFVKSCVVESNLRTWGVDRVTGNFESSDVSVKTSDLVLMHQAYEVGVFDVRTSLELENNNANFYYENTVPNTRIEVRNDQTGTSLLGVINNGAPYEYLMPVTTPNEGDGIFSNSAGQLYFSPQEYHVESRQIIANPVVGSKFRFTIPFVENMRATRLNFFVSATDGGSIDFDINNTLLATTLASTSVSVPPGLPPFDYAGILDLTSLAPALDITVQTIWEIELTGGLAITTNEITELSFTITYIKIV